MNTLCKDLTCEIFKYLKYNELEKTNIVNKSFYNDVSFFCNVYKKNTLKMLLHDKKCYNCENQCDTRYFKLCDQCVMDSCWKCYNKIGSINLHVNHNNDNIECIKQCKFKCYSCKVFVNKYYKDKLNDIYCVICYDRNLNK